MSVGKISWFGGPRDAMSGPTTASGAPVTAPGVAAYSRTTLGGFWLFELPNGRRAVIQQTDIGPAPWTGRTWDFTSSSLAALGYTEATFPTDAIAHGRYLGRSVPANLRHLLVTDGTAPAAPTSGDRGPARAAAGADRRVGALRALLMVAFVGAGATLSYVGLARTVGVTHPVGTPSRAVAASALAVPK
jgi:hypothetical protein